jgi:hypothetical protein
MIDKNIERILRIQRIFFLFFSSIKEVVPIPVVPDKANGRAKHKPQKFSFILR